MAFEKQLDEIGEKFCSILRANHKTEVEKLPDKKKKYDNINIEKETAELDVHE